MTCIVDAAILVALRTPDVNGHKGPSCNRPGRVSHLQHGDSAFTCCDCSFHSDTCVQLIWRHCSTCLWVSSVCEHASVFMKTPSAAGLVSPEWGHQGQKQDCLPRTETHLVLLRFVILEKSNEFLVCPSSDLPAPFSHSGVLLCVSEACEHRKGLSQHVTRQTAN